MITIVTVIATMALAVEPPSPEALGAAQLNAQARQDWKAGRHDQAIIKFQASEKLFPTGKYAFNVAYALAQRQRSVAAWAALDRAEKHGVEAKYRSRVVKLRTSLLETLLKTHARLELQVAPKSAVVRRNGDLWSAPNDAWTRDGSSQLQISAPGYVTQTVTWAHPVGTTHKRSIRLEQVAATTPIARPITAPADPPTAPAPDGPSAMTISKWTTLGVGAATLAAAVGTLIAVETINADLTALETDGPALADFGTYPQYHEHFTTESARRDDLRTTSVILFGTGAALGVVSATLFLLDQPQPEIAPVVLRDGGGLSAVIRF